MSGDGVRAWRALAVLALLITLAYSRALTNEFVFDDAIFVERDQRLESSAGIARLFVEPLWGFSDAPGQRGVHQYYRPLQLLPLAATKMLLHGSPWPVHLASLVLHTINALLVCILLRRLAASSGVALALAALFALHPANSEAVLWASDIAGLGATACILAAVLVHAGALRAWRAPLLVAPLVLVGALFKETGVLTLALMIAYDATVGRLRAEPQSRPHRGLATLVADYAAVGLALAVYLALRVHALGDLLPGAGRLELSARELAINAFALVPSFVTTFIWPFDLNMYRDFDPARTPFDVRMIAGVAVAAISCAAFVASRRRKPEIAFGLAWTAITALPHLIVRWPQLNAFAERYLYLSSIGVYAALAVPLTTWLARSARMRRPAAVSACLLLSIFALRDLARSHDWKDEVALYTATLRQSPRAELIRNNLALRYLNVGRPLEGIPIQEQLLEIDPDFPGGWHNLGLLLLAADYPDSARDAFERAAELEPGNSATALNLGYAYDLSGRRADAVAEYFRASALAPNDARPWYNLALIAHTEGQLGNARHAVDEALARAPADSAARALLHAIEKDTPQPVSAEARSETLRRCLAAKEAADAGRTRDAVAKLRAAAWLDEGAALPHHYLANIAYLAGRIDNAIERERAALERDPSNALYRKNLTALENAASRAKFAKDAAPSSDAPAGAVFPPTASSP